MIKYQKDFLSHISWFMLAFSLLIAIETILISLFTGYLPTKLLYLKWDQFSFILNYFWDEPFDTLSFIFTHKPFLKIEAILSTASTTTTVWGLHFYSYTIFTHVAIALLASRILVKHKFTTLALKSFPISGSILLILSSLYLYLSSCCTSSSNWIIHSWILSIAFNPYNATETTIKIYNNIHEWFIWFQFLMAASGLYLIMLKIRKHKE